MALLHFRAVIGWVELSGGDPGVRHDSVRSGALAVVVKQTFTESKGGPLGVIGFHFWAKSRDLLPLWTLTCYQPLA